MTRLSISRSFSLWMAVGMNALSNLKVDRFIITSTSFSTHFAHAVAYDHYIGSFQCTPQLVSESTNTAVADTTGLWYRALIKPHSECPTALDDEHPVYHNAGQGTTHLTSV
ncbi:hypothetical protein BDY19DRAFT_981643 [Irpex rosettiformis]|uniref:Uncharacterized protein n=1 Tax=Irpex rosettiformis TaxID=378272 RepID=A0ACB8TLV1_9APHY|nr:hypothetical protein BDY19DRAFT_981643 [Irpex rosettiformis]